VPQSYLKRFAHDSQRLWVFDKVSGIIFKSNVIDAAQKRYFYDLPERANNLGIDVQSAEKVLGRGEERFSTLLNRLLPHLGTTG